MGAALTYRPSEPDLFRDILRDHRKIEALIDEAIACVDSARACAAIYPHLREELRTHGFAEETVVYPFLRRMRDTEPLAQQAVEAQDKLDDRLDELDLLQPGSELWRKRLRALRSLFHQHVAQQEADVFPHLRRYFSTAALDALHPKFEAARAASPR